MSNELTDIQNALAQCEGVIDRGMQSFVAVGKALLKIRDERLYREQYGTFEEYCRKRWKWGRQYVNRQIAAAEVSQNLVPIGTTPQTESQARELTPLSAEQQRQAWTAALKLCANGKPTAREIAAAVDAMAPRRPSPEEARRIAVETNKPVLDSEGWYQPPIPMEVQKALTDTLDLLDLIVGFAESDLLKYQPRDLLAKFAKLREQYQIQLRRTSLDAFIAWLMEFEDERKNHR